MCADTEFMAPSCKRAPLEPLKAVEGAHTRPARAPLQATRARASRGKATLCPGASVRCLGHGSPPGACPAPPGVPHMPRALRELPGLGVCALGQSETRTGACSRAGPRGRHRCTGRTASSGFPGSCRPEPRGWSGPRWICQELGLTLQGGWLLGKEKGPNSPLSHACGTAQCTCPNRGQSDCDLTVALAPLRVPPGHRRSPPPTHQCSACSGTRGQPLAFQPLCPALCLGTVGRTKHGTWPHSRRISGLQAWVAPRGGQPGLSTPLSQPKGPPLSAASAPAGP